MIISLNKTLSMLAPHFKQIGYYLVPEITLKSNETGHCDLDAFEKGKSIFSFWGCRVKRGGGGDFSERTI